MFDASSNQQTLLVGGTWALFHITVIFGFESPGWAVNCRHLLTSRTDLFFRRISLIGSIYIYIYIYIAGIVSYIAQIMSCGFFVLVLTWTRGFGFGVNHQDSGSCGKFSCLLAPPKKIGDSLQKVLPLPL